MHLLEVMLALLQVSVYQKRKALYEQWTLFEIAQP